MNNIYARIRHDTYPNIRVSANPCTPETEPLKVTSNPASGKDTIKLNPKWVKYLRELNGASWDFLSIPHAGWLNKTEDGWQEAGLDPLAETIGFGGNVVEVIGVENGMALIKTQDVSVVPTNYNYFTSPELVHQFTVICKSGNVILPAKGIIVYIVLVSRRQMYFPMANLELFSSLPITVKTKISTLPWLNIRSDAGTGYKSIGRLPPMSAVEITDYKLIANQVWGRINNGWICLSLGWKEYTTWHMKTSPPPR